MVVTEQFLHSLFSFIDSLYFEEKVISPDEAEDLIKVVSWIIDKSLNESNIQYVIKNLRSFKPHIDEKAVNSVINQFRILCG